MKKEQANAFNRTSLELKQSQSEYAYENNMYTFNRTSLELKHETQGRKDREEGSF